MLHLNKSQLILLKKLSNAENIAYKSLSAREREIAEFLHQNSLITVVRESFPHPNPQTRKIEYSYGEWISISISEAGKAYLSERNHSVRILLLKDVFLPIIVTIITNLLINGMQWLLPLIRELLKSNP